MLKFLFAVAAACCVNAHAQDSKQLTYKGVNMGVSASEFSKALPLYECRPSGCEYSARACRTNSNVVIAPGMGDHVAQCEKSTSFGGAIVQRGTARFMEDKLGMILLSLDSAKLPELLQTITAVYGPPVSSDESPFMTKAGAAFPNWKKVWRIGGDNLTLRLRAGSASEGMALVTSSAWAAAEEAKRSARGAEGAKDF